MRSDITSPNNGILSATLFERTILTMVTIKNNPRYTKISLLRPIARILRYIFRKSKLDLKSPLLFALCKRTAGKKCQLLWEHH